MSVRCGSFGIPESSIPAKSTEWITQAAGTITLREPGSWSAVASGPRCAVTREGHVVCTIMVQSALGVNDFCPLLSRSRDQGVTWQAPEPIWPQLQSRYSIFGSVSASPQRDLFFFGTRTTIDEPGESFWCETLQGLKANELIWACSSDDGHSWSEPTPIPLPFACSAEAPGAMCVARDGTWHACFAPYNTFDPVLVVPRNQVVALSSSDQGHSWRCTAMLQFSDELATAAEAWVVELADGRLLGTCWNLNQRDGSDYPNAFSISHDRGQTWTATQPTGIQGQASALAALPDGSVLFVYNQRKHGQPGVWLARSLPAADTFGVLSNQIIWHAPVAPPETTHGAWTQFTFGEPSVTALDDGTILVVFWVLEQGIGAIRYVKIVF